MPLAFFSNSGSGAGSAVPFQRIVDPAQLGLFVNLEQAELLRLKRYNEAWRFYYGKHWEFSREDGEPLVTLNYARKFVDKHVEFLVSKGFVITTPDVLEDTTKRYCDEVWKYNNRDGLALEIATMGGVSGDAFILVTDEEPTEIQKKIFPFSQGKTRINLLGSEQVFPTWDPLNIDVMTSVRIETIYYADRAEVSRTHGAENNAGQIHVKRFTQIITPTYILMQFQGMQPKVMRNILGEIPLVHIKNLSVPREFYGMSDMQDLIDLNKELNEKSTDISDAINYHSQPITVILGAKTKQLDRSTRKIWSGLPKDANVFNLKLEGDLVAAQNYWDKIKKAMHEIGDVPEGIMGEVQPISNTSGVALHIQYQPIVGRAKRKKTTYEPGFEKINYFILRNAVVTGRLQLPFDLCANCGGKILETFSKTETEYVWNESLQDYEEKPKRIRKCYHVDKQTLDFADPKEMRVKIWRKYGFGESLKEVPVDEAKRIAAGARSYWDYAFDDLEEQEKYEQQVRTVDEENMRRSMQTPAAGPEGTPAPQELVSRPEPPLPKVIRLNPNEFEVYEEPEEIEIVIPLYHPVTGNLIRTVSKRRSVVPTGCKQPAYLNPYETQVTFNDVLPKDDALTAELYSVYQANEWVDAQWCQERIPEIAAERTSINKRLKQSGAGQSPPKGAGIRNDLAPHSPPLASVPGDRGNPTRPGSMEAG